MPESGGRRSRYYRNKKETGLSETTETSLSSGGKRKRVPVVYEDDLGMASEKQTVTSETKTPLPLTLILMIVVCTVMFMLMVWSFVRINEYTIDIEDLQDQLDDLKSSRSQLTIQLEQNKRERKVKSREQRQAEAERQFMLKQQKKKDKHRGR